MSWLCHECKLLPHASPQHSRSAVGGNVMLCEECWEKPVDKLECARVLTGGDEKWARSMCKEWRDARHVLARVGFELTAEQRANAKQSVVRVPARDQPPLLQLKWLDELPEMTKVAMKERLEWVTLFPELGMPNLPVFLVPLRAGDTDPDPFAIGQVTVSSPGQPAHTVPALFIRGEFSPGSGELVMPATYFAVLRDRKPPELRELRAKLRNFAVGATQASFSVMQSWPMVQVPYGKHKLQVYTLPRQQDVIALMESLMEGARQMAKLALDGADARSSLLASSSRPLKPSEWYGADGAQATFNQLAKAIKEHVLNSSTKVEKERRKQLVMLADDADPFFTDTSDKIHQAELAARWEQLKKYQNTIRELISSDTIRARNKISELFESIPSIFSAGKGIPETHELVPANVFRAEEASALRDLGFRGYAKLTEQQKKILLALAAESGPPPRSEVLNQYRNTIRTLLAANPKSKATAHKMLQRMFEGNPSPVAVFTEKEQEALNALRSVGATALPEEQLALLKAMTKEQVSYARDSVWYGDAAEYDVVAYAEVLPGTDYAYHSFAMDTYQIIARSQARPLDTLAPTENVWLHYTHQMAMNIVDYDDDTTTARFVKLGESGLPYVKEAVAKEVGKEEYGITQETLNLPVMNEFYAIWLSLLVLAKEAKFIEEKTLHAVLGNVRAAGARLHHPMQLDTIDLVSPLTDEEIVDYSPLYAQEEAEAAWAKEEAKRGGSKRAAGVDTGEVDLGDDEDEDEEDDDDEDSDDDMADFLENDEVYEAVDETGHKVEVVAAPTYPPATETLAELAGSVVKLGSGVSIKQSTVPLAGAGVFADRPFSAGSPITLARGALVPWKEVSAIEDKQLLVVLIPGAWAIDSAYREAPRGTYEWLPDTGRLINAQSRQPVTQVRREGGGAVTYVPDTERVLRPSEEKELRPAAWAVDPGNRPGFVKNARFDRVSYTADGQVDPFVRNPLRSVVFLRATKDIAAGDEILVDFDHPKWRPRTQVRAPEPRKTVPSASGRLKKRVAMPSDEDTMFVDDSPAAAASWKALPAFSSSSARPPVPNEAARLDALSRAAADTFVPMDEDGEEELDIMNAQIASLMQAK